MATFNSAQYLEQAEARINPSRLATANLASGTVEFAQIKYSIGATSEAAADIINLMLLPSGAIPMPQLSKVSCAADPGTTLTVDIGSAADLNGWADGIILSAGGTIECMSGVFPAWTDPTPAVADAGSGNVIIKATLASLASLSSGTNLFFLLAWKRAR